MRRTESDRTADGSRIVLTLGALGAAILLTTATPAGAAPETVTCLGGENCTANGLQVTNISVSADASDPTCSGPGDTVNVLVTQTIDTTGGSTQYDVGVGIDTSGGAGTACQGEILVPPNTTGSTSQLNTNGGANTCPDLGGSDVAVYSAVYTVDCADDDADGVLDAIQVFQVWANNAADNPMCTTTAQAFPDSLGTTAKCNYEITPTPDIVVPKCGDGNIDQGLGEQCDDGNTASGDGCSATCQDEFCGDGTVQSGLGEQCDDGGTANGDGCDSTCQLETPASCGDGTTDPGEQCDDGNVTPGDGCNATCQNEFCGDGILQTGIGETCDDGNTSSNDGCNASCQPEFCGDNIIQSGLGETCDDGNTTPGDGCSASCTIEQPVPAVGGPGLALLMLLLVAAGALALRRGTRTA